MQSVIRLLTVAAAVCVAALSQTGNAILSGLVTDPSGASVPGAAIVVTNNRTGVSIKTKSNESGAYVFPGLQPGSYDVAATHQGFRQFIARAVVLEVGAQATSNIALEVGSVA